MAKVDELMALCDQLEQQREHRVSVRETASKACLEQLTTTESKEELATAWHRLGDNFELLYDTPETVQQLRQSILELAVQGKLVPQDPKDEPRNEAHLTVGDFVSMQNGYAFKSSWFTSSGIRLVRNLNIAPGNIDWTKTARIPTDLAAEYERFMLTEGDIVLSLDRPFISTGLKVARITASDLPSLLLQRVARPILKHRDLDMDFFYLWLQSPLFTRVVTPGRSNGVPHISTKQVTAIDFSPPPLAEQKRIVAKVDELMALCDQLEQQVTHRQETTQRLLEATVAAVTSEANQATT